MHPVVESPESDNTFVVDSFEIAEYWIKQGHPYRQVGDKYVFASDLLSHNWRKPLPSRKDEPQRCPSRPERL